MGCELLVVVVVLMSSRCRGEHFESRSDIYDNVNYDLFSNEFTGER